MARVISTQYYFKGMIGQMKKYILKCKICQSVKKPTTPSYGLMGNLPLAEKPFDVVALDSILGLGDYNSTKNCLHVIVDHHSRYIWAYPSKSTSIATYINIINQLLNVGKPKNIVTDRHPSFVSKRFNKFIQEKGIKHVMTSPSHPQCNGLVERANATIISKLRLYHQQNPRIPWPKLLQKALEEYRSIPHSITKMPPVYLLFGITPSYINKLTRAYPPIEEARKIANENTEKLHLKLVKRYNESHKTPNLKIGDKILYKIPYQSGQVKLWDPVTEDNTEPPFPFQEEEDLEGCLGIEPNKQASTDNPQILHASHQGINNTIALAKGFIYWPGMNKEIEELINNCSICQQTSRANLKEPLLPHQAPEYPWQKVGIDIFQIESSKYLLIVDYFSKYPEIYQLQDMTTDTIIRRLKRTFSNFGIPETLVSDNGPPFFSKEFQNFTRTWNIVHVTSSPYHAQSNGMVERTVQTLKKLIKRCGEKVQTPT
ncbi:K02A2.6-like [Cordylochernes scorpioides]|uniref:RNA-directed DNA polymerase n=1 Tax=Cordylochernes scorpioides TaxID=51811 RepID=A0ABY6KT15_9ARAC|nr:K02A2.6-like [Cordylochernes scorpioides]